jgi:hypothetical protein
MQASSGGDSSRSQTRLIHATSDLLKQRRGKQFVLLSFFPQVWITLYIGFLQEIILPFDTVLGMMMFVFIVTESALAWRFLRSIITRQSTLYYRGAV